MKRLTVYLIAAAISFAPARAYAESPKEIALQMIASMQKHLNLDPVIEKVDWQGAYKNMDPAQRQQMGFNSPDDLKKYQIENYKGLGDKVREGVQNGRKTAKGKEAVVLQRMNERLDDTLNKQQEQSRKDFLQTKYAIGKENVGADTAEVEIIKTRGESSVTQTLEFVKVEGNWKIKSAAPLSPSATGKPGESAPDGLLGPSVASPDSVVVRTF